MIRVGVSRSGSSQKRSGAVVDKSYTGATRSAQAQLEGLLRSEVTPPVLESEFEFSLVDIHLTLTPLTPYELANWPSSGWSAEKWTFRIGTELDKSVVEEKKIACLW